MRRKRKKQFFHLTVFMGILIFLYFGLFFFMETHFMPSLKEISHMQCKTKANEIIDQTILEELQKIEPSVLIIHNNDSYKANIALVNTICTSISKNITKDLQKLSYETIKIPLGAVTNHSILANKGPKISFTLLPMGIVKTDYETAFSSSGINQINYKIWLHISMEIKIVNPLYQETLRMERKLMLADLVYSGKVPDHYFQISPEDEYLLTE